MCAVGIAGLVLLALPAISLELGNNQAGSGQQISGTVATSESTSNIQDEKQNPTDFVTRQLIEMSSRQIEMSSQLREVMAVQKEFSSRITTLYVVLGLMVGVLGIVVVIFIFFCNYLSSKLSTLETKMDTKFESVDTKFKDLETKMDQKFNEQSKILTQTTVNIAEIRVVLDILLQPYGIKSVWSQTRKGPEEGADVKPSSQLEAMRSVELNSNAGVGQTTTSSPSDASAS
jgi:predicted PurR-regulated permease PerM